MRVSPPFEILDVDLAHGVPAVDANLGRPALVILRYRGAVIGRAHLLPTDLPMTAAEFAAFAGRHVWWCVTELSRTGGADGTLQPERTDPVPPAPESGAALLQSLDAVLDERRTRPVTASASIVICTRHRPRELTDCLASIAAGGEAAREVIVVDNGPDPETEAAARAANARYVIEPRPGLNIARNTGLRASNADVVVFVDDDVRPEPGFVDALLRRFDRNDVGVVCGLVLPLVLETDAQVGFEYALGFGGMGFLPLSFDRGFLAGWRWGPPLWELGAGANMAVRRDMALRVGGFDERLGAGVLGGCGDDTDFWHNILASGGIVRYEPLSVVRHRHRETWSALERQAAGYAKGHVIALFAAHARGQAGGNLSRAFGFMPAWYVRRILHAPTRWMFGDPDRLLFSSLRGYFAGLRHVRLAFARQPQPRASTEAARREAHRLR